MTGCKPIHTSGFFSLEEGSRWQNEREALGVMYAIKTFWTHLLHLAASCSRLDPLRVLILQDNAAVVAYIRKMGGSKAAISRIVETFLREGLEEHIMFLAEWIAGSEMPADAWSRALALHDLADWELLPASFKKICHKLDFFPTLDLFASRLNTKCPRYFSFRPDPYAEGWDALSDDKCWSEEKAYAAPPPHLIPPRPRPSMARLHHPPLRSSGPPARCSCPLRSRWCQAQDLRLQGGHLVQVHHLAEGLLFLFPCLIGSSCQLPRTTSHQGRRLHLLRLLQDAQGNTC